MLRNKATLDPDVKGRIIGIRHKCLITLFFLGCRYICERILSITENLSKTLQTPSLSAAEAQGLAELTVKTLVSMRTDEAFELFFNLVEGIREATGTTEPPLPRKRKAPEHLYEKATTVLLLRPLS